MSAFVERAAALRPDGMPDWLQARACDARAQWSQTVMPTRKTEDWKYLSLKKLEAMASGLQFADSQSGIDNDWAIDALDAIELVFVNGRFCPGLSASTLPEGLELVRFADASADDVERVQYWLGRSIDQGHVFEPLNAAWLHDGLMLRVAPGCCIQKPVHLVHKVTGHRQNVAVSHRLLVRVEQGAGLTLVEHFVNESSQASSLVNAVSECFLGERASLFYYRLNLESGGGMHLGNVQMVLEKNSRLDSFFAGLGSDLLRVDAGVRYSAPGGEARLNGIYMPRGTEVVDYHTRVDHVAPHCNTEESFRGLVSDAARAVFNGKILIHQDAQKSVAHLSNKNLLTSNRAEVDTKPELEIYADDVQCSHGATVAQLDEKSLFYLKSRGISHQEALKMLSFGFVNALLEMVAHKPVSDYMRPLLVQRFGRDMTSLMRHLL
jgi:Fe-S cluster assembly protein SufD